MGKQDREQLLEDVARVQRKIVAASEAIVDSMTAPPPPQPKPTIETVRRYTAELIGTWRLCERTACRRARHCRGEAMHCLRTTAPLFPPDFLADLISNRRKPRRPRR